MAALPEGVPSQPQDPVTDLAGMLSAQAEAQLNQALRRQWQAGHFQLAVLTLPSIGDRAVEDVGIEVARAWGLGGAEADNGVLLLIAAKEHRLRLEVGQKLEGRLTDAMAGRILDDIMTPRLRQDDADGAVLNAIGAVTALLDPQDPLAAAKPQARERHDFAGIPWPLAWLFMALAWGASHPLAFFLCFILLNILLRLLLRSLGWQPRARNGRWGGGGGFGGGGFGGGSSGGFGGGGGGFSGGGASGKW